MAAALHFGQPAGEGPSLVRNEPPASPLKVHFIDVGQGDSMLLQAPDGKVALIDGGEQDSGALAYLNDLKIKRVDLQIATHPHADHIGGLVDVLQTLKVVQVWAPGSEHDTNIFMDFIDAIDNAKVEYHEPKAKTRIAWGSLAFEILHVDPEASKLDNSSIVAKLEYGEVAFMFTGDVFREAEQSMLEKVKEKLPTAVLKVAHHGSDTSSTADFLAAVSPKDAVYCAGLDNKFGHPSPDTIDALKHAGAKVYGTDVDHTIVVTTDGHKYDVQKGIRRPPHSPPAKDIAKGKEPRMESAVIDSLENGKAVVLGSWPDGPGRGQSSRVVGP
jgi:competence protein ComEC